MRVTELVSGNQKNGKKKQCISRNNEARKANGDWDTCAIMV